MVVLLQVTIIIDYK